MVEMVVDRVNSVCHAGQIELYSHIPVLRNFVDQLKRWDFNVCAVYMLDSQVFISLNTFYAHAVNTGLPGLLK